MVVNCVEAAIGEVCEQKRGITQSALVDIEYMILVRDIDNGRCDDWINSAVGMGYYEVKGVAKFVSRNVLFEIGSV